MKIKIDNFTKSLLREKVLYFVSFAVFLLILIFFIPSQIADYENLSHKIDDVKIEISKLEKKDAVIRSYSVDEVNKLIEVLNRLVPQSEDYFSIFQTLDKLSADTGFKIVSYSIGLSEGNSGKISLSIGSEGTPDSLLNFLERYQYEGGRLITMDSIKFQPNTSLSRLAVNLYSKDIKVRGSQTIPKIDQKIIDEVRKISDKIGNVGTLNNDLKVSTDYATKPNPFE